MVRKANYHGPNCSYNQRDESLVYLLDAFDIEPAKPGSTSLTIKSTHIKRKKPKRQKPDKPISQPKPHTNPLDFLLE